MKQFKKWWHNPNNEELNKLYKKDAPRQDWAEAAHREALEWVLEELQKEESFREFEARIEGELQ